MDVTRLFVLLILLVSATQSQPKSWYTQGDFKPRIRIEFSVVNELDINRQNCSVVIARNTFPIPDIHEMWVTVVDPAMPPSPAPSADLLKVQGGHQLREESNGHSIFHQLDDLDKDGIWDELFFQTNLKPKEQKTMYIYIGQNIRGWNKHFTHANIGSYCRHTIPFWESEHVGWKIWFANSVDVFAKREPVLMADELYMNNYDGYGVSQVNRSWGSDIMSVEDTFGGGAICLFEHPENPDSVSVPRFTPIQAEQSLHKFWNAGQLSDSRYAYEVVVNGPLRSTIKIKTMNWNSGDGFYEFEQYYTAYAHQSYCVSKVVFTAFQPNRKDVAMGCGIRRKPNENNFVSEPGLIITSGPEGIRDPEQIDDRQEHVVGFIGSAIVVRDTYDPRYQYVPSRKGNHAFRVEPDSNNTFEFMLFCAWSEGAVHSNAKDFNDYVRKTSLEYNKPAHVRFGNCEQK